jgi:hypothetical protein
MVINNSKNWTFISAGANFMGALKSDGTMWVWGMNSSGQMDNENTINLSSPIQVLSPFGRWSTISCGLGSMGGIVIPPTPTPT